jgi:hypothetical protein
LLPKYFVLADAPLLAKPVQNFSPELSTPNPAALKSAWTGNLRSVAQQELSHNECAPLDKEHREARVMESRKWDAVRKDEREEFADFDDDEY